MSVAVVVPRLGMILKACVFAYEAQPHRSYGTVTLLANNHFRYALIRRILVVDLISVDEGDNVRILLDRSRFSQVRHDWSFVRSLL